MVSGSRCSRQPQDQQQWVAVAVGGPKARALAAAKADLSARKYLRCRSSIGHSRTEFAVLRMVPLAREIRHALRGGDHALLRRAHLWHRIAGDFCRGSFGLTIGAGVVAAPLRPTAGDRHRTVL
jgi:hypothetical protein